MRQPEPREWYRQLVSGQADDPERARRVKDDLGPLFQQKDLMGTRIEDIECHTGACAVRVRSDSPEAQYAAAQGLATHAIPGADLKIFTYDEEELLTTVYLASADDGSPPAGPRPETSPRSLAP